jgi:class 3 adenylate cyclase
MTAMGAPPIRYARAGDAYIAYQVSGDGPLDILLIPEAASHLELMREEPHFVRVLERLEAFGRLIVFDKRGTGLSDPVAITDAVVAENWVADAIAVLDEIGSRRAAVIACGGGVQTALLLAAMHPRRVVAQVLLNGWVRLARADDYPIGFPDDMLDEMPRYFERMWGTGDLLRYMAPELARDPRVVTWWARYERNATSPGVARALNVVPRVQDFRPVLKSVRVPTLVMHRERDIQIPCAHGRYIAEHIRGAKLRILGGESHLVFGPDADEWLDEAEEFLTGRRDAERTNRVLTTLLFTDIVRSTEVVTELGDERWKELLDRHDDVVRRELTRFGGRERDTAGDGFLATFTGPAHAIRCARSIAEAVRDLGLEVRTGVHTGEVELRTEGLGGIAVHLAHRVMERAGPSEVVVSRTVVDLVAGSEITFEDRGEHELKGVPGTWSLYAVQRC